MTAELPLQRSRGIITPWARDPSGRWTLVHGDCIEIMKLIPDRSIDSVMADPPYLLSNGGTTCQSGELVSVQKGEWDRSRGIMTDHEWHYLWLEQVQQVLKPTGTCWISATHHALFSIGWAMQRLGFHVLNLVTWSKPNASPHLACRYVTHSTEHLIWAAPHRFDPLSHTYNYGDMKRANKGKQLRDVWTIPTTPKREKAHGGHPTQKPLALMDRIIAASTKPGDLVLDPFTGSSSSGVSAVQHGRRFIGIEMEEPFLELSKRRLETP